MAGPADVPRPAAPGIGPGSDQPRDPCAGAKLPGGGARDRIARAELERAFCGSLRSGRAITPGGCCQLIPSHIAEQPRGRIGAERRRPQLREGTDIAGEVVAVFQAHPAGQRGQVDDAEARRVREPQDRH
jgi:hypothetical protein